MVLLVNDLVNSESIWGMGLLQIYAIHLSRQNLFGREGASHLSIFLSLPLTLSLSLCVSESLLVSFAAFARIVFLCFLLDDERCFVRRGELCAGLCGKGGDLL
eukprot:TRINITY_DN20873_c0_g1_i1.p1 TRINITY_DN20873_c0_g1~~TRINITY_DN20873_c0_g1_i1.p1  ORF type:complete len:103 (-),score=11.90 TRINITY_DN20873_c0_g1_i1:361-669(-)